MVDRDMKKNIKVFRDTRIFLEKGFIQCPKATCRISALSQISLEKSSDTWLFSGDGGEDGLILELDSGSQYVFFAKNKDILNQAYEYLCECMTVGIQEGKWLIDFEEGVIKEVLPEAYKLPDEVMEEHAPPEIMIQPEVVPDANIDLEIDRMIEFLASRMRMIVRLWS